MQKHNVKKIIGMLVGIVGIAAALLLIYGRGTALEREAETRREISPIRFSEVMTSNDAYPDEQGAFRDWVELHNESAAPIDLSGWGLSDRAIEVKYTFPKGTILPADGYLLVYCEKGSLDEGTAPFSLASEGGETLTLFNTESVAVDEVLLPVIGKNRSYVRVSPLEWSITDAPTPGYPNDDAGSAAYREARRAEATDIRIGELMAANRISLRDADGEYSDWIELVNTGRREAELTGWYLTDDPAEPFAWQIPALSLRSGERVVIFCSGKDRTEGELHTSFALDREGGGVYLYSPTGRLGTEVVYESLGRDESLSLREDGAYMPDYEPTPGYPNDEKGREAFIVSQDRHGALVLNEIVPYNNKALQSGNGTYPDWIELKNTSAQTIRLSDYTITTNAAEPTMYRLPDVELQAGKLLVILCTGGERVSDARYEHLEFNIGTGEERLYLYDGNGELSDCAFVHDVPYGGSLGRMEGKAGFFYFEKPTPGKENDSGERGRTAVPTAETAPGVYEGVKTLSVAFRGEGELYYTTDGSLPTRKSARYTRPIKLSKTTVLRVAALEKGKTLSDVATYSYILNEGHTIPVVSLTCDPKEMFTGKTAVYEAYTRQDECDGFISLFNGGDTEFASGCSITLHGCTSRKVREKKSLKIEFNDRFGGDLVYDLFGEGKVPYSSLLLRTGTAMHMSILRDPVAALAAKRLTDTALALDHRYCVLYINGEYFGVYGLREDYSSQYAATHLASAPADVMIAKAPVDYSETALDGLGALLDFISRRDMTDAENYRYAAERFDMTAMADWMLLEMYYNNWDVAGNVRYIKAGRDAKWRVAFYDLDLSMGNGSCFSGEVFDTDNQAGQIAYSLWRSEEFRTLALERAVGLLQKDITGVTAEVIDELIGILEPEIGRETSVWSGTERDWTKDCAAIRSFFTSERTQSFIELLAGAARLTPEEKTEWFGDFL